MPIKNGYLKKRPHEEGGNTGQFSADICGSCVFSQMLGETLRPGGLDLTVGIAEASGINQNHTILDIGCGKGSTAAYFAKTYGCRVVGIDLSREMVHRCRDRAEKEKLGDRARFLVADGRKLPFPDSKFDFVISECYLSLNSKMELAAAEIGRVLKSGGKLAVADFILRGRMDEDLRSQIFFPCCLAGARKIEEYINIFQQAGFSVHSVEDRSHELEQISYQIGMTFGSIENYLEQALSKLNMLKGPASSDYSELFQEFIRVGRPGYALLVMVKS